MRKNDLFGSANVIGIIRRVDDLGRIVIPMEIRKELGLFTGQPCAVSSVSGCSYNQGSGYRTKI